MIEVQLAQNPLRLGLGCTAAVRCRNGPSVFPRKPLWFAFQRARAAATPQFWFLELIPGAFCQNRFNGEGGAFLQDTAMHMHKSSAL